MINPRTWSSEELQLVKRDGSTREVKEAAAAELARREQAGPTPGPWLYEKDRINWRVYRLIKLSQATTAPDEIAAVGTEEDAALIARAPELAAENERLRALVIATATGIREVADLLAPTAPATAASLRHRADAAIEAAKEATHAK